MKIYVVGSSKNDFLPLDNIREKYFTDVIHQGETIDEFNSVYCELTGLYHLWKNVKDDIVGLEHYRRYFLNDKFELLKEDEIRKILETNDIICIQEKENYSIPLYSRFIRGFEHGSLQKELDYMLYAVKYLYPDQFESIRQFLSNRTHYQFNMFICKKEIIDKYCEWMFPILQTIQQVYGDKLTKRSLGFLAEIVLFSYYITVINKLKIYKSNYRIQKFKKFDYR